MTTYEILKKARKLITPSKKWCRGKLAADIRGRSITIHSPSATSFCALGSVFKVAGQKYTYKSYAVKLLNEASKELFKLNIIILNDNGRRKNTHAKIMECFDLAIKKAKSKLRKRQMPLIVPRKTAQQQQNNGENHE